MAAPDTIVLLHGFWVTHRSWQEWAAHYEHRGYRVLDRRPLRVGRPGPRRTAGRHRALGRRGRGGARGRRAPR
jgi:hypothetical protein